MNKNINKLEKILIKNSKILDIGLKTQRDKEILKIEIKEYYFKKISARYPKRI